MDAFTSEFGTMLKALAETLNTLDAPAGGLLVLFGISLILKPLAWLIGVLFTVGKLIGLIKSYHRILLAREQNAKETSDD